MLEVKPTNYSDQISTKSGQMFLRPKTCIVSVSKTKQDTRYKRTWLWSYKLHIIFLGRWYHLITSKDRNGHWPGHIALLPLGKIHLLLFCNLEIKSHVVNKLGKGIKPIKQLFQLVESRKSILQQNGVKPPHINRNPLEQKISLLKCTMLLSWLMFAHKDQRSVQRASDFSAAGSEVSDSLTGQKTSKAAEF